MKEKDYINVRDLSNVIHAREILKEVAIKNQTNIDAEEYREVMRILAKWEEKLFAVAETG